jgi:outer membrane translocation and assembly module TamA
LSINFLGQNAHSQEDDENAVESQNSAEDSPLGMEFSRQLQQLQDTSKTINNRNARRKQNEYYPQYTYFVSDFDDPRKLEIHGAKTFSPVEIKSALFKNLSVIHAATPSADLLNFEKTLKNAALAGYRQAGFPDAKITAKANREDKHFRMDIEEGVRYLAGNIIVRNAKTISAEKLIARLQSKHLPANATLKSFQNVNGEQTEVWVDENGNNADLSPPVWVPGKPAAFESWTESPADRYAELFELKPAPSIIEDIKSAFEVQGYFFVKFESRYVLDKSEKTATLAIEILDEGPLSEIGSIEILGNKINTEEEVLNYLGVRPGMPFTREDLLRLNKKLWDAARFIKAKTTPMKPASAGDKLLLRIELVEYPHAPALSKPFSAEEQIMLKFGAWLSDSRRWDGDLTLRYETDSLKIVVLESPVDGTYAHYQYEYRQTDGEKGAFRRNGHVQRTAGTNISSVQKQIHSGSMFWLSFHGRTRIKTVGQL